MNDNDVPDMLRELSKTSDITVAFVHEDCRCYARRWAPFKEAA